MPGASFAMHLVAINGYFAAIDANLVLKNLILKPCNALGRGAIHND
jgi:hypothetical protein